jgi:uncharacterized protein (TIGR03083 family)
VTPPCGDHIDTLLGAWALGACDAAEADMVEAHLRSCAHCAEEATTLGSVIDMLGGVAADSAEMGPPPARAGVLTAARARRRPAPTVPDFAAPFAATAGLLESVLAEVDDDIWARPSVVLDWTAGDLVAHLAATDGLLAGAIGLLPDPPVDPSQDVVARSQALIAMARTWPREKVRRHWRAGVDAIAAALVAHPELATRAVDVGTDHMPVAGHVIVRAFETWIHARDIAGLAGLRIPDPAAPHLRMMSDLSVRILDSLPSYGIMSASGAPGPSGAVQVTLTGPGGGSWSVRVGTEDPPPAAPDAELVIDTVEFCLRVADRRTIDELDVVIAGDAALATEFLALAPSLARP